MFRIFLFTSSAIHAIDFLIHKFLNINHRCLFPFSKNSLEYFPLYCVERCFHLRSVFTKSTRYILRKVIYWHFFLASHILMMVGCWVTWTWSSSETRQSRRIADNHLQGRRKRGARGAMIPRFCRNRKYNRSRKTLLPSFFPQIFGPSAVSDLYCLL